MLRLVTNNRPKDPSLADLARVRHRVLVKRDCGGLGDILVHRMMFEDFKLLVPGCHLTFACPPAYFPAVRDHPFLDAVADCNAVDPADFQCAYNTSTACVRYEMAAAPHVAINRADVWAAHCGLRLTRHDMHIRIADAEREWAADLFRRLDPGGRPAVAVAPVTSMANKNLAPEQVMPVAAALEARGYFVFAVHDRPLDDYDVPCLSGMSVRQFMAVVDRADAAVCADTAAFHLAGGLGKPTVAVCGWADGKVMARHYRRVAVVQRHRDDDPDWACGPCHNFTTCAMCPASVVRKPCLTSITPDMILAGFDAVVGI